MEVQQNTTDEFAEIEAALRTERRRRAVEIAPDPRWDIWVDYRALNGTIIEYNESLGQDSIRKMTVEELADKLGVDRTTLYRWETIIPDFWGKVRKRKKELSSQKRLSLMEDKFFLKAMTWDNPLISLKWMEQNNPDWRDPRYKIEHEAGNSWAALFEKKQQQIDSVIEGEVVDAD